jgi:hypothetical protein
MEPLELISGPFDVYVGPVGEAFPDVDTTPAGNWFKLGTGGAADYDEGGVKIKHGQKLSKVFTLGSTGPRKVLREQETMVVSFTLLDLSPEQYAKALNDAAVTSVAAASGTPGYKKTAMHRGSSVSEFAVLVKGAVSSEGAGFSSQYQIPRAYMAAEPEPVFEKGKVAGLAVELEALEDTTAASGEEFGHLIVQDADAL